MTEQTTPETTPEDPTPAPADMTPPAPAPAVDPDTETQGSDARKESAKYRKRAQEAEASLEGVTAQLRTSQLHLLAHALGNDDVKAEALIAAGHTPESLISEAGDIDREKLNAAVTDTAEKFGIYRRPTLNHVRTSGTGVHASSGGNWADALRGK